ncbi:hypothetical protein RRG08_020695 [Elysia crispata]|uniref:Uncharacterized protein n=1 Tax=Elysia crispata TaxID=231223 RepID=A0AAE1D9V4_9GAST|nr:hypothetical protein RRG08_020695 [Elysia crispata]
MGNATRVIKCKLVNPSTAGSCWHMKQLLPPAPCTRMSKRWKHGSQWVSGKDGQGSSLFTWSLVLREGHCCRRDYGGKSPMLQRLPEAVSDSQVANVSPGHNRVRGQLPGTAQGWAQQSVHRALWRANRRCLARVDSGPTRFPPSRLRNPDNLVVRLSSLVLGVSAEVCDCNDKDSSPAPAISHRGTSNSSVITARQSFVFLSRR